MKRMLRCSAVSSTKPCATTESMRPARRSPSGARSVTRMRWPGVSRGSAGGGRRAAVVSRSCAPAAAGGATAAAAAASASAAARTRERRGAPGVAARTASGILELLEPRLELGGHAGVTEAARRGDPLPQRLTRLVVAAEVHERLGEAAVAVSLVVVRGQVVHELLARLLVEARLHRLVREAEARERVRRIARDHLAEAVEPRARHGAQR